MREVTALELDQLSKSERSRLWRLRFMLRERLSLSLLVVPALYIVAALILAEAIAQVGNSRDVLGLRLNLSSAQTFLSAVAGGMIAFTGLVVSIAIVVVQFGASQYTPRLVSRFRRDPAVKHALGIFIAPAIFALVSLRTVGRDGSDVVPSLTLAVALVLLIAAVLAFFGLVSRLLDLLRPRRVIAQIVERTVEAARATYPFELREDRPVVPVPELPVTATVRHEGRAGVLSALDRARLVRAATAADAVVEAEIEVGGFVPTGAVLFTVRAQREPIDTRALRRAAILAEERTITLDPSFGVRAIVDLALRALSPAVNDPTTAVQALDGLDELLRELAVRDLDRGHVTDERGALRLLYPNPGWSDLLDLALIEIRHYGADSPQIARRMRALLLGLAEQSPELRRPAVEAQLVRLDAAVAAAYDDPVEREHAMRRDRVGIGGGDHPDAPSRVPE